MNKKEAAECLKRMDTEKVEQIVFEHYHLRQHLCAVCLGVPTGCEDWLARAIDRAMHLRECETQLRIIIELSLTKEVPR